MKKFIKENWVKVGVISIVLLCGITLLLYLQIQQKEVRQKQLLESSIKCSQDGLKFFESYKTKTDNTTINGHIYSSGYIFNDPVYYFNKELNTCLISVSYTGSSHVTCQGQDRCVSVWDIRHAEVTDVYTNKILISTENSKEDTQFQQQEQLLMNK